MDRSVEPDRWPVVARQAFDEPWHQFDMSTAEFVYDVMADPEFKPFTVADTAAAVLLAVLGAVSAQRATPPLATADRPHHRPLRQPRVSPTSKNTLAITP
ncbi:hypothetical protein AB0H57_30590 [Micromonospora sp. NPDC050686]|uniref:hypothetical protein n=1 Tax=Micromonospora sp. NPDC050686 TaxID=3154631 RepID=UPI0033D5FE82